MTRPLTFCIVLLLAACAQPSKPKSHTAAPSLGTAQAHTDRLGRNVTDAKDYVGRARKTSEQIDDKLIRISQ